MLPLHCSRCGRLIGRAEKETIDGQTVCTRCFKKLGGGEVPMTRKKAAITLIVAILATILVLGGLFYVISWINDAAS